MAIFDLYSKRRKRERGEYPDVYQYEKVPQVLRVQIVHIWSAMFGNYTNDSNVLELFEFISRALCREYGLFVLTAREHSSFESVANFLLQSEDNERALDVIELTFQCIAACMLEHPNHFPLKENPTEAIDELNRRFKEHGVGFQYESGQLIKIDSHIAHAEIVKPALQLLAEKRYEGANEEFLSAHSHYRDQNFKECLIDCLKAFESTMKAICVKRGWANNPTDTAKPLIDVMFQNGLIPGFMQSHFSALRSTLEAGVPTVRNKLGGHGQGSSPIAVPEYLAAYCLHLTASNILLLAQAERSLK
ncbi:MAG: hypothetical protein J0L84_09590 [Verrucomicrobia bacterium]|nr:hypothetical protein [Verrucomicrobiota bacterium]